MANFKIELREEEVKKAVQEYMDSNYEIEIEKNHIVFIPDSVTGETLSVIQYDT